MRYVLSPIFSVLTHVGKQTKLIDSSKKQKIELSDNYYFPSQFIFVTETHAILKINFIWKV